ncbi:hypothetical protein Vadar_015480 [Vaccinium darrowii]|uniref:Uncharacterized protein n=1 Tax=Vaccinium darrowii TaxID=229202 RepID=A0ACB7X159_9ERIC|nr:hypothetical protein Vadar_015480 [Vaccinium darrowii]
MDMNMKRKMKMRRGFMCQSPGATAVCMTGEPRLSIVPRRPDQTVVDLATSLTNDGSAKYARLVRESAQRFGDQKNSAKMRSTSISNIPMPAVKRSGGDKTVGVIRDRSKALQKPAASVASSADQMFQVVVMRVSLHCQGCAGKVKKHISKMEGVTSFSIDLESKRVTVMGHVSPVGVLESISKVKRAEFWPC